MKEKNKRKMHGGASAKSYTGLVLTCVMTAIAVIYVGFAIYFESHFCFGTSIDGIAVGGSSVEKVEDAIRTEMKNYNLTVTAREDKNGTIAGSDIDMEPVFQGEIEKLLEEQNGFAWLILMFQKQEFELAKVVSYDEQKLDEAVRNLPCMKDQRTPVDATYSDYTRENGYALVPADYGTQVDTAKVRKAVSDAVLVLDETVDLEQSGCYLEPAIGDDDKDLLALIDALNQYVGVTITYDFGDDKEVLDGTTISTWLSEGTDEKVSIDEEEVLAFVKTLAKKYNTAYSPKELKTSYGTTVTITGGFYGWRIDNGGEVEQILADLKAGKDVEREPVYLTTANSHGEHDYGDFTNFDPDNYETYEAGDVFDFDLIQFQTEEKTKSRSTSLRSTLNLGAEYTLLNNKLGFGLLSSTQFTQPKAYSELTLSANYRPRNCRGNIKLLFLT